MHSFFFSHYRICFFSEMEGEVTGSIDLCSSLFSFSVACLCQYKLGMILQLVRAGIFDPHALDDTLCMCVIFSIQEVVRIDMVVE